MPDDIGAGGAIMFISYNVYAKTAKGEIIADYYTEYNSIAIAWGREFRKMFPECQIIIVEHKAVTVEDNTIISF